MNLQLIIIFSFVLSVYGIGMLLLYRPKDITRDCAFSRHLRYDISFGMGMSDTITLVFRILKDIDYECLIEIVTSDYQYLLVVIRYPNAMGSNCAVNRDAITVLKRQKCIRLCDLLSHDAVTPYFIFTVQERLRFLFKSNSSINCDMNANFYQVTITSARLEPDRGCDRRNETDCVVDKTPYCFTTGVVCDGIKNCGVDDWFDERRSKCDIPVERLSYAPVIAVIAALLCAFIAGGHTLMRCLPSPAGSFFIFNANEDNRLCIDPLLVPKGSAPEMEPIIRTSVIPVYAHAHKLHTLCIAFSHINMEEALLSILMKIGTLGTNYILMMNNNSFRLDEKAHPMVFDSYSSSGSDANEGSQVIEMQTLNTLSEGNTQDKEIAFEETTAENLPEVTTIPRKSKARSLTEKFQDTFKFIRGLGSMSATKSKIFDTS